MNTKNVFSPEKILSTLLVKRWQVGEVESCGVYPRCMKWLDDPRCRFCGHPCETTIHLLIAVWERQVFVLLVESPLLLLHMNRPRVSFVLHPLILSFNTVSSVIIFVHNLLWTL